MNESLRNNMAPREGGTHIKEGEEEARANRAIEVKKEEAKRAENERIKNESEAHIQFSHDCGVAAYAELTSQKLLDKQRYTGEGIVLKDQLSRGSLYFGTPGVYGVYKTEGSITSSAEYIRAFTNLIRELTNQLQNAKNIETELIEKVKEGSYQSIVDNKYYNYTDENWRYGVVHGDSKEAIQMQLAAIESTLQGFLDAARKAGDNKTCSLVYDAMKEHKDIMHGIELRQQFRR